MTMDQPHDPNASRPAAATRRGLGAVLVHAGAFLVSAGAAHAQPTPRFVRPAGPDKRSSIVPLAVVTGGRGGTYVRIAEDLASVLEDTPIRVLPVLTRGSGENLDHLLYTRGIDAALVQTDALWALQRRGDARAIEYAAKLYDEEVHILAGTRFGDARDLAGERVNFDRPNSGTALTAAALFAGLGVPVQPVHDDQETALGKLSRGEIAAMVYVAGKPVHLLSRLGTADAAGLRLLPVPLVPALLQTYMPARIEQADYPVLAGGGVDTLAVGTLLAVYAWPPGTERHDNLARFVAAMFERLPSLRQAPHHPKWRDVSPRSLAPGLVRFAPARDWVRSGGDS